jgi:hypothetical protein
MSASRRNARTRADEDTRVEDGLLLSLSRSGSRYDDEMKIEDVFRV